MSVFSFPQMSTVSDCPVVAERSTRGREKHAGWVLFRVTSTAGWRVAAAAQLQVLCWHLKSLDGAFQDPDIFSCWYQIGPPAPPKPPSHGHGVKLQFVHSGRIMGCSCRDGTATWNEPRKPLCFSLMTSPRPFAPLHTSWGELLYFHPKIHIKSEAGDVPRTPTTAWSAPPVCFGLPRLAAGALWTTG